MSQIFHFTVGSLPNTKDRSEGFFNFEHELDLLKAALLYADQIKLCSVGASFMAGLNDLSNMSFKDKLTLVRQFYPMLTPGASREQLEKVNRLADALGGSRAQRRAINKRGTREARRAVDENWNGIENLVQEQFRTVPGAEDFRVALQSGLVELHPFKRFSAEGIMQMGVDTSSGLSPTELYSDEVHEEYADRIYAAVQDRETYPLFDDTTGNMVGEAVREGLIQPSRGAVTRGRHGGLSGDILQRLPLFEKASVSALLDIRKELAPYLDAFREAVSQFAHTIGSASWDEEFAEEAELIFWERVATAVRRIEQAVEENRSLQGLSLRYGPSAATGAAAALNAFVGSGSVLASLALLAAGVYQGVSAHRLQHKQTEGAQVYFYYRASNLMRRSGP